MTIVAGGIRRLALVRLDRIGDFLLWVNTARFYRRHFHEAEIVLFGNEAWADLALAMPYWDRFVPVRVSDENEPVVASDELPFGHFDVLLATQYSRTAAYDRFISGFQSIRKVAVNVQGPNLTESDYKHGNTFYSDLLDLDRAPKHELVRNFEFLNAITGADQAPELESLAPFLRPVRHELPDRYVAVFPGSTWSRACPAAGPLEAATGPEGGRPGSRVRLSPNVPP